MTKATNKRVYWELTVSEGESITIMVQKTAAAGKHGTGAVAESLYPYSQHEGERREANYDSVGF